MWTWLRVISTGLRGGAAMETTLVPLKKPLLTALCQRSLAPHPCGDQVRFQAAGLMCVGSLSRPHPIGAFSIPHEALLRSTDQSHHETWLHLDFVEWQDVQPQREKYYRKLLSKERPAPYQYGQRISDIMSDHSLSS